MLIRVLVRLEHQGLFVVFYLYLATGGRKGHGSGLPLPSWTAAGFSSIS